MFGLDVLVAWLHSFVAPRSVDENVRRQQLASFAAFFAHAPAGIKIIRDAQDANDTQLLDEIHLATLALANQAARRITGACRPQLEGSPAQWNWRVDEAATLAVIREALEDAIHSSIFDPHLPRTVPYPLTGSMMRDMLHTYNEKRPESMYTHAVTRKRSVLMWTIERKPLRGAEWVLTTTDELPPPTETSSTASSLPSTPLAQESRRILVADSDVSSIDEDLEGESTIKAVPKRARSHIPPPGTEPEAHLVPPSTSSRTSSFSSVTEGRPHLSADLPPSRIPRASRGSFSQQSIASTSSAISISTSLRPPTPMERVSFSGPTFSVGTRSGRSSSPASRVPQPQQHAVPPSRVPNRQGAPSRISSTPNVLRSRPSTPLLRSQKTAPPGGVPTASTHPPSVTRVPSPHLVGSGLRPRSAAGPAPLALSNAGGTSPAMSSATPRSRPESRRLSRHDVESHGPPKRQSSRLNVKQHLQQRPSSRDGRASPRAIHRPAHPTGNYGSRNEPPSTPQARSFVNPSATIRQKRSGILTRERASSDADTTRPSSPAPRSSRSPTLRPKPNTSMVSEGLLAGKGVQKRMDEKDLDSLMMPPPPPLSGSPKKSPSRVKIG